MFSVVYYTIMHMHIHTHTHTNTHRAINASPW